MIKLTIVSILLCAVIGCSNEAKQPFSLDYIYSADPKIEAQKAIKRGDFRFYAIHGIGRSVPGVQRECITDINQIIPIEGTSEITYSYEENQFNLLANLYAEYYNTQIKYHLAEQGNKCFFYPQGK